MSLTRLRTVLSLSTRRLAICALSRPCAIIVSTSCSRGVSWGNGLTAVVRAEAKKPSTRSAMPAPKTASPRDTPSIARWMSSPSASLRR